MQDYKALAGEKKQYYIAFGIWRLLSFFSFITTSCLLPTPNKWEVEMKCKTEIYATWRQTLTETFFTKLKIMHHTTK